MPNYRNGKIYKLINTIDNKIYIGSTCDNLAKRKGGHKHTAHKYPNRPVYQHLNSVGWNNVRIVLIENCEVKDREGLNAREQYYIDLLKPSLNKNSAVYSDCPHNRVRSTCKECGGSSICEHNRVRSTCKECGGSSICEHNRVRSRCIHCNGSQICQHNKRRDRCIHCNGSQICEHKRRRSECKDCGGSQICQHNKRRDRCIQCGGSSICQHKRERSRCIQCNGSQVCEHSRRRDRCVQCNGDKYNCDVCDRSFGSKQHLKSHRTSMKHKKNYQRVYRDVFGEDIKLQEITEF